MRLHNDEPVLVDELDRSSLVQEISKASAFGTPPLVLGVHGDWGLGKTSLLHQIQYYLSGECPQQRGVQVKAAKKSCELGNDEIHDRVRVVWFEAWRYQNERVPIVALLHEMRAQLGSLRKAITSANKLSAVAVRGALLSMEDLTKMIGFQASKIEEAGRDWEREHLAARLPSHTIREQLEAAIAHLLSDSARKHDRRVVVLIDDLDRCEPEAAYRLLEGLKIYLTVSNCVFILGMNQQVVEYAIGKHIPGNSDDLRKERAGAYLEKLCQNIWRVPTIRQTKKYLLNLLPDTQLRLCVDQAIGQATCLPPNPRRIKGLANLLIRFENFLSVGIEQTEQVRQTRLMLIVALVYQFHHDLYRRWEMHPILYERMRDWCTGTSTSSHSSHSTSAILDIDPMDETFKTLKRVVNVIHDPAAATPASSSLGIENAFPDPSDTNVFWAQQLILEAEYLERQSGESRLKHTAFEKFLSLAASQGSN